MNPFGLFRNVIGRHASTAGVKSMLAKAPSTIADGAVLGAAAAGSSIAVHKVKEALEGDNTPDINPAILGSIFDTRNYGLVNLDTRSDMGQTPNKVPHQRPLLVTIVVGVTIILAVYAVLRIWYCMPWHTCKKNPPKTFDKPASHPRTITGPPRDISTSTGFKFTPPRLPAITEAQCTIVDEEIPKILPRVSEDALYENYSVVGEHCTEDKWTHPANESYIGHPPSVDIQMATLDQAINDIKTAAAK